MTTPANLIFIQSDHHNRQVTGLLRAPDRPGAV